MSKTDPWGALCWSDSSLKHVHGDYFRDEGPRMLLAITLEFETASIMLVAREDDSLDVIAERSATCKEDERRMPLDDVEPWRDVIGKPLMWVWKMVNQQGYWDGIQFDFARRVEDKSVRIQILVEASQLKVEKWGAAAG